MMATQTVEFRSPPSQTVTAKLFSVGSDTQVASVSTTEATNRKGTYSAAYTDVSAGEYELIALVGAVPVARWFVTLTLTTATFQTYDKVGAVELDPAARVKLDGTQPDYAPATASALTTVGNNVTAILEDTGTTIPAQITALNNLSSAQVVSALGTGTWATALPWNAAWDAEVQSEVQDAIEVNNLDHLVKIAVDTNFATTVHLDSIIGHMADNGTTATFSRTTDSLEAIRDNQTAGSGASLPDIIAGVQSVSGAIPDLNGISCAELP